MNQSQRRGGGVFWGLLWGAILIVMFVIYRFALRAVNRRIGTHPRSTSVLTGMQFAFFCLVMVLLLVAGLLAARRARSLESGIAAGFIAAFLLGLVELAVAVIDAYHARHHGTPSLGSQPIATARSWRLPGRLLDAALAALIQVTSLPPPPSRQGKGAWG